MKSMVELYCFLQGPLLGNESIHYAPNDHESVRCIVELHHQRLYTSKVPPHLSTDSDSDHNGASSEIVDVPLVLVPLGNILVFVLIPFCCHSSKFKNVRK